MAIINNFDSQYGGNRRSEAYGNLVSIFGEYSDFSFFFFQQYEPVIRLSRYMPACPRNALPRGELG
jgi:hypothetical protein